MIVVCVILIILMDSLASYNIMSDRIANLPLTSLYRISFYGEASMRYDDLLYTFKPSVLHRAGGDALDFCLTTVIMLLSSPCPHLELMSRTSPVTTMSESANSCSGGGTPKMDELVRVPCRLIAIIENRITSEDTFHIFGVGFSLLCGMFILVVGAGI